MNTFTTIYHQARLKFKLNLNEYAVADSIYHLSNNPKGMGWCYASKITIAKFLGISERHVMRIIKILIKKGLVFKNPERKKELKTTELWYNEVIVKKTMTKCHKKPDKMSSKNKTKCHKKDDKMSHNSNNSNSDSNNNKNIEDITFSDYTCQTREGIKRIRTNTCLKFWCEKFSMICDRKSSFCLPIFEKIYKDKMFEFIKKGFDVEGNPAFYGAVNTEISQQMNDPDSYIQRKKKEYFDGVISK